MSMLLEPTGERAQRFLEREEFGSENMETPNGLLLGSQSDPVSVIEFFST